MLWVEREGLWSQAGLSAGEAAVIVMVDNHPAPSGLKTLLIGAGLFPVGEITLLFSGAPQEMLPASPQGGLLKYHQLFAFYFHPFLALPISSLLQAWQGQENGKEMFHFHFQSRASLPRSSHRADDAHGAVSDRSVPKGNLGFHFQPCPPWAELRSSWGSAGRRKTI